ncbi:hypothetical protein COCC4DRAFT_133498, partial [Bipolaris maydis ATCC 48331]
PCPCARDFPPRRSFRFYAIAMGAMWHSPMASHCEKATVLSRRRGEMLRRIEHCRQPGMGL